MGKHCKCARTAATFLLSLVYLSNQLGRYALPLATQPMAQELYYGEKSCLFHYGANYSTSTTFTENCTRQLEEKICLDVILESNSSYCKWDYNGQGVEYQLLIGPYFILIYTFTGIFIGFAADLYNRKILLSIAVFMWNSMTLLTSQVTSYWQLVLTRFGLGLGVAGCNPFAVSILADTVPTSFRAAALGIYNWGIYTGFSLSFAIGNTVVPTLGWRWFFFICGIPGILLAVLVLVTVREPSRRSVIRKCGSKDFRSLLREGNSVPRSIWLLSKPLLTPTILILCVAGSIRNAAGYVWGYNTQIFYQAVSSKSLRDTQIEIASYLSWIPLVAGSFSVFAGGLLTDQIVKRFGIVAQLWTLAGSQLLAAPFALGALFLPAPFRYLTLIPAYIISELWVSVCQAVLVELIPSVIRTSGIAIYFFIITNIGGNMPLLVPSFKKAFMTSGFDPVESLRYALCILYPGMFVLSGIIFGVATLQLHTSVRQCANTGSKDSADQQPDFPETIMMLQPKIELEKTA